MYDVSYRTRSGLIAACFCSPTKNGDVPMDLNGRSFLKEIDFTKPEFLSLIDLASDLREDKRYARESQRLKGRNIALIFEKTSTRTRSAFEVAAHDQGAHVSYLGPGETQLGKKETVKDTARVLGRMYDGIEFRGFAQGDVEELARHAGVPVWNGLTDQWHPTQMLADMLTMSDYADKPLESTSYCYMGDARNNTANSLLVTGGLLGMDVRICAPQSLWPSLEVQGIARELATHSRARITITEDVAAAVPGVDFIYTDVWVSMGERTDHWAERIEELVRYQVTARVMAMTANRNARFMHCLPAIHNRDTETGRMIGEKYGLDALEVTDEVFESSASIVFDQAENRLHTIKAVMVATLGDNGMG
jgi:ornithine carbamoyltransferase